MKRSFLGAACACVLALGCHSSTKSGGGAAGNFSSTDPVSPLAPSTNNVFVKQNPANGVDKIDVLFAIDNSLSMGDKQAILESAVSNMLRRLTNPNCIDPSGINAPVTVPEPSVNCPAGFQREFPAIHDIHLGVVTSSLGDFGGDTCPEDGGARNAAQNDHAWLLGSLPRNATKVSSGELPGAFLTWSPRDTQSYPASVVAKSEQLRNFLRSATEIGCGFEMVLESWYRFLIDPNPPIDVTTQNAGRNVRDGLDQTILNVRKAFLRPDSLVAVVMLSDESDCSIRDDSYGWALTTAGNGFRMWRGSSVCNSNPNDPCCYSCMLSADASAQCRAQDTNCTQGSADAKLAAAADDVNLRCRQTKRRFGNDFLFPPSRYVNALSKLRLCPSQTYGDLDCDCTEAKKKGVACIAGESVANPLYANLDPSVIPTGPTRIGSESVLLLGILGVPWQDLAVDPADAAPLVYKKATELNWDLFAPQPDVDAATAQLGDPLMLEATAPRQGRHPITGQDIAPPTAGFGANKINGHEWNTSNKDVQFACTFTLDNAVVSGNAGPRACDLAAECGSDDGSEAYAVCARRFNGCSCILTATDAATAAPMDPRASKSPLCQSPEGAYGNVQYFAKAYPGLRQLQVLRGYYSSGVGDNALVGSICPKDLEYANRESDSYGYNPALKALVDQISTHLGRTCLSRSLAKNAEGILPCAIIESISPQTQSTDPKWCNCEANGRSVPSQQVTEAVKQAVARDGICGGGGQPSCDQFCFCQLKELLSGTASGEACYRELDAETTAPAPGFCYIDPENGSGDAAIVASCPATAKRIVRIVGNSTAANPYVKAPAPGHVYIACSGDAYGSPEAN